MQLSNDQQHVYDAICHFINSDKQVFILYGYAGTGKTTLLAHVVEHLKQTNRAFNLMAPTGRAAHILRQKTGVEATTIHRGIYDFDKLEVKINEADIAESEFKFHYPIKIAEELPICIVDEGSMVGNHYSEGELWTFGSNRLLNDLITYSQLNHGGKLIIIGDSAQLPPVKESVSLALTSSFYQEQGYMVESDTLTEIFRQNEDSQILNRAADIRQAISHNNYTQFQIQQGEDISAIPSNEVAATYLQLFPEPKLGNSVIICYSNATANLYNERIRQMMYGDRASEIQIGDLMIVVSNRYAQRKAYNPDELIGYHEEDGETIVTLPHDIMNGEFVQIVECNSPETRTIPVYENKQRQHIQITFVNAVVQLMSGELQQCKMITEPILSAPKGTVSITLLKALFIDFCMRNRELCKNPHSEEFHHAIKTDPYLNALRVRYGYSITGHKSQGGEWDSVFVDFEGVCFNEQGARWMYTAVTRARKKLYMVNYSRITPTYHLKFNALTAATHKTEFYPSPLQTIASEFPFHDDTHSAALKFKYSEMVDQLAGSPYTISQVQHLPYRERYTLHSSDGNSYQVDWMYKADGMFRPATISPTSEALTTLLSAPLKNTEVEYPALNYDPSNNSMQYLFDTMCSACDKEGIDILHVEERLEHYKVVYCLKTSSDYAWITFFVNAKGFITYGAPYSKSLDDTKLIGLINKLSEPIQ